MKGAGKDGHTTVFLLTDTQIKQESFLEDVDGLLNAGEVANLYAIDEKQDIIEVIFLELPAPVITIHHSMIHVSVHVVHIGVSMHHKVSLSLSLSPCLSLSPLPLGDAPPSSS